MSDPARHASTGSSFHRYFSAPARHVFRACLIVALAGPACGGGGDNPDPPAPNPPAPPPATYSIGGTVAGLKGTGLALQNNGADTLAISASGTFTFATALANAATYAVTVSSQPAGQTCTVGSGSGTVAGAAVTSVSVTCADNPPPPPPPPQAPVIVRPPKAVEAQDHGSALFFVVATGTDLNYEWRSHPSGTVLQSGPEPFLLRDGLNKATQDGDCWHVTVSNAGGSVASSEACVSISEIDYDFNEDGGSFEADADIAEAFGNGLLRLIVASIGNLTGPRPFGLTFLHSPLLPGGACGYSGDRLNPTLDGAEITTQTPLPPGRHTVSLTWNECRQSPDDTLGTTGALLMTYDFPSEPGVGSYTIHFSGYQGLNGSVDVTVQRSTDASNRQIDDIRLIPRQDFSIDGIVELRQTSIGSDRIDVVRRLDSSGAIPVVDRTTVDFNDLDLAFYDSDGVVASIADVSAGTTTFNSDGTATGDLDIYTSTGPLAAPMTEFMGTLVPAGDGSTWSLELDF